MHKIYENSVPVYFLWNNLFEFFGWLKAMGICICPCQRLKSPAMITKEIFCLYAGLKSGFVCKKDLCCFSQRLKSLTRDCELGI